MPASTAVPMLAANVRYVEHDGNPVLSLSLIAIDGVDDARSRHRMCQRVIVGERIT